MRVGKQAKKKRISSLLGLLGLKNLFFFKAALQSSIQIGKKLISKANYLFFYSTTIMSEGLIRTVCLVGTLSGTLAFVVGKTVRSQEKSTMLTALSADGLLIATAARNWAPERVKSSRTSE